jgi:hypothetical protein
MQRHRPGAFLVTPFTITTIFSRFHAAGLTLFHAFFTAPIFG